MDEQARVGAQGLVEFTAAPIGAIVEGDNAFRVLLRTVDEGAPLEGAALAADPVMRSMGHDTAAEPTVTELGAGEYELEGVVFTMPGLWELRLAAEQGGIRDEAAFFFEVP